MAELGNAEHTQPDVYAGHGTANGSYRKRAIPELQASLYDKMRSGLPPGDGMVVIVPLAEQPA
jgi:hypothetical protein